MNALQLVAVMDVTGFTSKHIGLPRRRQFRSCDEWRWWCETFFWLPSTDSEGRVPSSITPGRHHSYRSRAKIWAWKLGSLLNSLWALSFRIRVKLLWKAASKIKSTRNNARKKSLTRTWFEHATFWSGVRRATIAPPGLNEFIESVRGNLVSVWTFRNRFRCSHAW